MNGKLGSASRVGFQVGSMSSMTLGTTAFKHKTLTYIEQNTLLQSGYQSILIHFDVNYDVSVCVSLMPRGRLGDYLYGRVGTLLAVHSLYR